MERIEMKFHEITLADKEWMDKRFAEDNRNACEYTFSNNFIWRKAYQVEVAEIFDCLVIRFHESEKCCYSYPVGAGDKRAVIEQLMLLCAKRGCSLTMSPLCESDRKQLMEWFPGEFFVEANRDGFDYIYAREKLESLAGKKLHGKRNHIARFKDGGDWLYEPMTEENMEECRTMTYTWIKMRSEKWNDEMEEEIMVLHEAFDHMQELGLVGGILRRDGEIVAFSMGEPLNEDTFVVHFEKAYPDMQGAYPMINQQFVINECQGYTYVNREEDTGDLGLRKAKLSYYPEILLKKYVASKSDIVYASREKDGKQIEKIWETCFGDDKEYIRFYLEQRMTEENMLVIYEDGQAVSMASFLPVRYLCDGVYVEARYVYAVGTLPEYRGKGLAKRILSFAQRHYGQPLILAPAEESLMRYYETLGFQKAFSDSRERTEVGLTALEWKEEAETDYKIEPLTAREYVKIRDEKYQREGYVQWDEEAVSYAMELCSYYGGKAVAIHQTSGKQDILMYEMDKDVLVILETSLEEDMRQKVILNLLKETGAKRVVDGGMFGMIWMPESMENMKINEHGYLALTLG